MTEKNKVWVGLGAALLAGTSLVGTSLASTSLASEIHSQGASWNGLQVAAGEAGEAGEGGEGGGGADLGHSTSAYLTQLALMRGHLSVGVELYQLGAAEAAATHMKHPEDELYEALEEALEERGAPGFEAELEALAAAVETGAGTDSVLAAYEAVLAGIAKAEQAAGGQPPHEIGEVIQNLVRTAAEEYSVGVVDGKIVNGHEYQDALGFVRVAKALAASLEAADADATVVAEIAEQIASLEPAWPAIVPPETVATDPSLLHGAAARIEIAVLGLED